MKEKSVIKPASLAIWMLGNAFNVSAADAQVAKEVIDTAISQSESRMENLLLPGSSCRLILACGNNRQKF